MTWVRIRSWHVVAFTTRTGAVKTRCGRLLRVQGTINTPGLETQQIHLTADVLPLTDRSCETCLRLSRHDADSPANDVVDPGPANDTVPG